MEAELGAKNTVIESLKLNQQYLKIEPELQIKVTSHSRKKSKKRGIEDLPETVVEHDLEDKTDPQTGKPLRLIGTNERKELVHHKEDYEVVKHIQYVYSGEYD